MIVICSKQWRLTTYSDPKRDFSRIKFQKINDFKRVEGMASGKKRGEGEGRVGNKLSEESIKIPAGRRPA
jgi:hypothetical protein